MKKNKKDDDAIVFDRDTSAPKNKMKNQAARRRNFKNNEQNNKIQNNLIKEPNNIEVKENTKKDEEEEEEVEEDVEEEVEEEPKQIIPEKKPEKIEIKKEDQISEKKEIKKEEKKETEPKITIQLKKNETNNSIHNKSNSSINNKSSSIHNKSNNSNNSISSKNNSNHNSNKNLFNNNNYLNNINNINNLNNNKNIEKKNVYCQVNLINDDENARLIQTLKKKINNLTKENQKLILQEDEIKKEYEEKLSQKKQEIMSLSQINAKLRKNLEKVSNQVNQLLDKVVEKKNMQKSGSTTNLGNNNLNNNKRSISSAFNKYKLKDENNDIFSNEDNKNKDPDIEVLKVQLKMKESQLQNSLKLIEFLRKDNKKLKMINDSIGKDDIENNNINNYKLIEEIRKKNKEIIELEKQYKQIALIKSGDKELEYYKNQVIQLKEANNNNESKIKKLKLEIEQYKNKNGNFPNSPVMNIKYKLSNNNESKSGSFKIGRNEQNNKEKRSLSVVNSSDWRNPELNNNFNKLFNEAEKKALHTLFENEDEYKKFNNKLTTIEKHYIAALKRYESNNNELKQTIEDKNEQIAYLREKIRENEMKIKILLNQVHLERHKNDKNEKKITSQQGFNTNKNTTKNS